MNIFVVPREIDFITLDSPEAYRSVTLIDELKSALSQNLNVRIHDLLPHFKERLAKEGREYDEAFLPCDGHWSAYGHEIVAEVYKQTGLFPEDDGFVSSKS